MKNKKKINIYSTVQYFPHLCICPPRIYSWAPCSWAEPGSLGSSSRQSLLRQPLCRRPEDIVTVNIILSLNPISLGLSGNGGMGLTFPYLGIQSASVDNKCIEWRVACQPNLLQWPVLHKHPL